MRNLDIDGTSIDHFPCEIIVAFIVPWIIAGGGGGGQPHTCNVLQSIGKIQNEVCISVCNSTYAAPTLSN